MERPKPKKHRKKITVKECVRVLSRDIPRLYRKGRLRKSRILWIAFNPKRFNFFAEVVRLCGIPLIMDPCDFLSYHDWFVSSSRIHSMMESDEDEGHDEEAAA